MNMISIKEKIRSIITGNRRLYILTRFLKSGNTDQFFKLVYGYYKGLPDVACFVLEHLGNNCPENIIYDISIDVPEKPEKIKRSHVGLFAQLRYILQALNTGEQINAIPVINYGINSAYYDSEMDNITKNVFEYYFKPVSHIDYIQVDSYRNVIKACAGHAVYFMRYASCEASYNIDEAEIRMLAGLYKKYIHLNDNTKKYMIENISACLRNKKTLGIHIRGTDYKLGIKSHPNIISVDEYISLAKEFCGKNNYEQIFLATDDLEILNIFQNEFGNKLVYYNDTFRTSGDVGPHNTYDNRPFHYYKLGLEVIRDVYTLANCDSLICGLSQVAFAARYVKISMDQEYEVLKIINYGIKQ